MLSLVSVRFLNILFNIPLKSVKYEAIEGLRGYLAIFVFIHHSILYFYYLHYQNWNISGPKLFNHFGEISVVLFFMITGFLFSSKLINQNLKTNWIELFTSRILRVYPAFIFLSFFQIVLIFFIGNFTIHEPTITILKEIIIWLGFSIIDYLPINGFKDTNLITANVLWTIRYEWVFYFSLPILSLIISKYIPKIGVLLVSSIMMIIIAKYIHLQPVFIYAFGGGILTALIINNKYITEFTKKSISSFVILGCILSVVLLFDTAYGVIPISMLFIAFVGIASGNNLFGILTSKTSKHLGQLSYSIYLLHGIVLYFTFMVIIKSNTASSLTLLNHWLIIAVCSVFVILVSFVCFKWIEAPCIASSKVISNKINKIFNRTK